MTTDRANYRDARTAPDINIYRCEDEPECFVLINRHTDDESYVYGLEEAQEAARELQQEWNNDPRSH